MNTEDCEKKCIKVSNFTTTKKLILKGYKIQRESGYFQENFVFCECFNPRYRRMWKRHLFTEAFLHEIQLGLNGFKISTYNSQLRYKNRRTGPPIQEYMIYRLAWELFLRGNSKLKPCTAEVQMDVKSNLKFSF